MNYCLVPDHDRPHVMLLCLIEGNSLVSKPIGEMWIERDAEGAYWDGGIGTMPEGTFRAIPLPDLILYHTIDPAPLAYAIIREYTRRKDT